MSYQYTDYTFNEFDFYQFIPFVNKPIEKPKENKIIYNNEPKGLNAKDLEEVVDIAEIVNKQKITIENPVSIEVKNQCTKCQKKFVDAFQLEKHLKTAKHLQYNCNSCLKKYSTYSHLKRHISTVHLDEHFICDMCGRKFTQKTSIETHLLKHLNERPFLCSSCPKRFATRRSQKQHINYMHDPDRIEIRKKQKYFCSYCNKSFNQKSNVKIHEIQKHETRNKKHICFCDRSFATWRGYTQHLLTHVPSELRRKFICPTCGMILMSYENLERHEIIHLPNRKRVKCTSCRADFVNKLALKRHMREVHLNIKRKIPQRFAMEEFENPTL